MVRGPMRCPCCGQQHSSTDLIGFRCACDKDEWGFPTSCKDCGKCHAHCACPEGVAHDWDEVQRRSLAGTLFHQRLMANNS